MILSMVYTSFREGGMGSDYARYVGVGVTILLIIAGLTAGGYLLDSLLGTVPLFLLLGVVAGFAVALFYTYLQLKKLGGG
ncbi:MAG TPA: AtpZ/AtpI family protein [Rubrobacteraceae bacterium]|nr:AtpZ/AtpI family protein [Rubrobacteraceae bacterium]